MQFVYLAVLFFCCLSCSVMNKDLDLPDDNQEETGVKVDLTPKIPS